MRISSFIWSAFFSTILLAVPVSPEPTVVAAIRYHTDKLDYIDAKLHDLQSDAEMGDRIADLQSDLARRDADVKSLQSDLTQTDQSLRDVRERRLALFESGTSAEVQTEQQDYDAEIQDEEGQLLATENLLGSLSARQWYDSVAANQLPQLTQRIDRMQARIRELWQAKGELAENRDGLFSELNEQENQLRETKSDLLSELAQARSSDQDASQALSAAQASERQREASIASFKADAAKEAQALAILQAE